jgi:dTDP-4-amino-4,6-dideoxygalactose transaminase
MKILFSPPFIDELAREEIEEVLSSGWITTGPKTKELEDLIALKYNIPNCLGVNSWTSGVIMLLKWWGIEEGDEVVIPSYTYAATALAVIHAGGVPIMVDAKDDFTMNVDKVREAITPKTKAIIPVDVGGVTADYDAIMSLVKEKEYVKQFEPQSYWQKQLGRVLVIADAAHSLGAKLNGQYSGTLCDITVFSLHAVKNVTAAEGGVIGINLPKPFDNEETYRLLRRFSLNGQTKDAFTKTKAGGWQYDIVEAGMKCNMPDLNAALALGQLKQYEHLLKERKRVHNRYSLGFKDLDWTILPVIDENKESCYHIYPLRVRASESVRNFIIQYCAERDVALNVHFKPLPELTLFKDLGFHKVDYTNSLKLFKQEISLPIYPQLTDEAVDHVIDMVIKAHNVALENKP